MRTASTARETAGLARRWEEVQRLAWPSHTTAHFDLPKRPEEIGGDVAVDE